MSTPEHTRVVVNDEAGVRVVRLARPERRNVLDSAMAGQLAAAFVDPGPGVGAFALLAEGDHFCVGGDVRGFASAPDPRQFVTQLAADFHEAIRAIRAAELPVVVGHRGWAAGAGMSLVLAGDIVVSGRAASMQPAYPGIGVTPDGGMTWTLPRVVGARRANAILLENRALPAEEAHGLGIVDHVVDDAEVDDTALEVARRCAASARGAMVGIKRLVRDGAHRSLDEQLDAEADSIGTRAGSAEGREGFAAFLGRRAPDFEAARNQPS